LARSPEGRARASIKSDPSPVTVADLSIQGRQYVITLALIVDDGVQVSVIGCPRLSLIQGEGVVTIGEPTSEGGIAIAAVRGDGAWWSRFSVRTDAASH
jgi:3'-phosphoadenosine 5'-phosphosulfate (PAPS) 3'-phosphatase